MRATAAILALLPLAACGGAAPVDRAALAATAAALTPQDGRLADLYTHSCRACHSNAASGAPLTGDRGAWQPRWQKGSALLLAHTIQGFNGMPAGGQCAPCAVPDYEALIKFMAQQ